jgi:hypothetical protein
MARKKQQPDPMSVERAFVETANADAKRAMLRAFIETASTDVELLVMMRKLALVYPEMAASAAELEAHINIPPSEITLTVAEIRSPCVNASAGWSVPPRRPLIYWQKWVLVPTCSRLRQQASGLQVQSEA